MIKSLDGKYEDILAMLPLAGINSKAINTIFQKVLCGIMDIGLKPKVYITYNHSCSIQKRNTTSNLTAMYWNELVSGSSVFLVRGFPRAITGGRQTEFGEIL